MKIAIVYNRESKKVINLFGVPNREKYGLAAINRIVKGLKQHGHQVIALEGDKNLIDNLENFMPRVIKGELPGLVFNLSYGIQGQARYTHVPGILEMIGIPYVGSGPLAHSLALDKVVAKMIFRQSGLPTPDFTVVSSPDFASPELVFPLIVKPKNEAVSFGIKIVHSEQELRDAAKAIFDAFNQPVLIEQYIEGREINVGILGNNPPFAFEPAELTFSAGGPNIYTYEDKTRKSGREIGITCPAQLDIEKSEEAKKIAIQAFTALGCYDCARIDMRMDDQGNFSILEINSLPSLGMHGSYVYAAEKMGMDFPALLNKLVEVASARYFGLPTPPESKSSTKQDSSSKVLSFLTTKRDQMENRLEQWCSYSAGTGNIAGRHLVVRSLDKRFQSILMQPNEEFTDNKVVWTWESKAGFKGGTLFVTHIDMPSESPGPLQGFRRDPEWLYGDAIGAVWGPLIILEFALRSLRHCRKLKNLPVGVLCYSDEGFECRYSGQTIKKAMDQAGQIIVMRPGSENGRVITQRRGQRKYQLLCVGKPLRLGRPSPTPELLPWLNQKLVELNRLTSRKERLAVSPVNIETENFPKLLPHRASTTLLTSFPTIKAGDVLEERIRDVLGKSKIKWELERISNRPPFKAKQKGNPLVDNLAAIASEFDIPFVTESSVWPSVAGLVKQGTPVLCGMGPTVRDLYTSRESVQRISIIQRTLLIAQLLIRISTGKL